MKIEEISFREWVLCKVRWRSMIAETPAPPRRVRPVPFKVRRAGDRRLDDTAGGFTGREMRRTPERRIPEVEETSFAEFERWQRLSD